jgi:hypothetical protein
MAAHKLTILFGGMIAADPHQGGATWAVLQYLLGLLQLGHEAFFIEPIPPTSLRPQPAVLEESENAAYFGSVTAHYGLHGRAALLLNGTRQTVGLPYETLRDIAQRADLLINISGMLTDADLLASVPRRVYLDLDPAFNQLWHAVDNIDMRFDAHTHFATVGLNLGHPECSVPTCGRDWIPTTQPVVLQQWPPSEHLDHDAFTTVANWRGYGSVSHNGIFYGQKAHSWRQLMGLPSLTPERFQPAVAIHPDETSDLALLHTNGWELLDPSQVAGTPDHYRRFVQGSKAEIGIAKSGYILSNCGWFSDRSVCYLASGRPVVAQETGWSRVVPAGEGVFAFSTVSEAVEAVETIRRNYQRQAQAARHLAEAHFDSNRVLPQLVQQVM